MDEKEEQELIEKGLRFRPTITDAKTYIMDENGNEIEKTEGRVTEKPGTKDEGRETKNRPSF
jgi:hypothetical protein